MDPLSIIGSIAGISTAGISLSRAIYDVISSVRNAPKEVSDIAKGLCDLSITLKELRRVLNGGRDVYRRKLIRRLASAIRRVGQVQGEIKSLLEGTSSLAKLKWIFRKSKVTELLYAIESHKTSISLILQTMILAVQLKEISRYNEKTHFGNDSKEIEERLNDVALARQQADNMVQRSFHSLQEPASETTRLVSSPPSDKRGDSDQDAGSHNQQIQTRSVQSSDSAMWLFDLVFSPVIEANSDSVEYECDQRSNHSIVATPKASEDSEESTGNSSSSQTLNLHSHPSLKKLQALTQQPPEASTVINELLSEWTTLTEGEIEGVEQVKRRERIPRHSSTSGTAEDTEMIHFKDAFGRKFNFPFELVRDWKGMEELIKNAFLHVDSIGAQVQHGYYDILNSREIIVVPKLWKYFVKPGETFSMHMWPMDNL
ncbi:hypothetical protein F5Y14DRAFT_460976 [Nemania sp. NC0429]|nr:hypothetical protein F5Y14DRAFT_460976 [Nemania sp. NC0429]